MSLEKWITALLYLQQHTEKYICESKLCIESGDREGGKIFLPS